MSDRLARLKLEFADALHANPTNAKPLPSLSSATQATSSIAVIDRTAAPALLSPGENQSSVAPTDVARRTTSTFSAHVPMLPTVPAVSVVSLPPLTLIPNPPTPSIATSAAEPLPFQSSLSLVVSPSASSAVQYSAAPSVAWEEADLDNMLKAGDQTQFTEDFGLNIRAFLANAELFLTLCCRPRDRWGYFVLTWLCPEEAEKVRCSQIANKVANDAAFCEGLVTLFGRSKFKDQFREKLRMLHQAGAESVSAYAARKSKLCSHGYFTFSTEAQTSHAVAHFFSGLADTASREFLRRERARRPVAWQEEIQIALAGEIAESDCLTPTAAAGFASAKVGACSRKDDVTNARAIADKVAQQQTITALQQATLAHQQATAAPMWQSGGRAISSQERSNSNDCTRGGQRTDRSRSRQTPRTSNPLQH